MVPLILQVQQVPSSTTGTTNTTGTTGATGNTAVTGATGTTSTISATSAPQITGASGTLRITGAICTISITGANLAGVAGTTLEPLRYHFWYNFSPLGTGITSVTFVLTFVTTLVLFCFNFDITSVFIPLWYNYCHW